MSRPLRLTTAALLTAVAVAAPAPAQLSDQGLFSVSPSKQTVAKRPPASLTTARVSNTTAVDLDVTVFPVLLGQEVDGAYTFSEAPRDLNAAAKILSVRSGQFVMPPGTAKNVPLRWNLLPTNTRAAFVGVVFQSRAKPKSGQQVKTVQRLLTVNFLRLPGAYKYTGRFTRLRASQGPDKTLLFFPRLQNTGEFVGKPTRGKFRIRDASGKIVFNTRWTGDVILPGYQREFQIEVKKVLQAGSYTAVASADFGSSKGLKIIEQFKLVGPNELPTPRVEIQNFHGEGELGGDSRVTGTIKSIGTAPATTAVRLDLYRLLPNGQQPVKPTKTDKLTFDKPIAPGQAVPLEQVYPKLPAGNYRVIGTYRAEPGSVKQVVTDWKPTKPPPEESFFDKNGGLILGILGGLLALLLLRWFVRRQRRLRRELEEAKAAAAAATAAPGAPAPAAPAPEAPAPAPAAPAASEPPAAAAGGLVNINTASVAELQQLPGIGPKAAERVVAHREEYGPFASLDDLAQVEGFGDKRVDGLRDRAQV